MGGVAVNLSETPSQVASAYDAAHDAPTAPAYLANGPMLSLGELGHIFDPAQAADDLSAPFSSEAPYNNKISGGGRTLRIGQPEFTSDTKDNWNTNGRRAIELLDLFTVNATAAGEEYPSAAGRINPNTAPPEVLAAVLSGIQITSDRGIPASSLADPFGIASNIVSNRPYSTLSDLHKIVGCFAARGNVFTGPARFRHDGRDESCRDGPGAGGGVRQTDSASHRAIPDLPDRLVRRVFRSPWKTTRAFHIGGHSGLPE